MTSSQFANLYYIPSLPGPVQFLFTGTYGRTGASLSPDDKFAKAVALSAQGYIIDVNIMAGGADPLLTMLERLRYGQARYPSMAQEQSFGGSLPAGFSYSDPSLAIKNSVDPADYPNSGPVQVTLYVNSQGKASDDLYNTLNSPQTIFQPGQQHFEQGLYWIFIKTITGDYYWELVGKNPLDLPVS